MLGQATGDFGLTDSPRPKLEGSHHLPLYNIFCTSPWRLHPNGFLSWDSRREVLKLSRLGFSQLCEAIASCSDLWLKWGLKQTCSSCRKLFNSLLHATCTHGSRVDSQLFMVGSQTANLTPNLSFCHNLCYKCPNGSCEPILNIYTSIFSNDIKNSSMQGVLISIIILWRFESPLGLQLPQWEFIWECESSSSHSLTFSPKARVATFRFIFFDQVCV